MWKNCDAQKTKLIFLCPIKMKVYFLTSYHTFLLLCDNKNVSSWITFLTMSRTKIWCSTKKNFVLKQKVWRCTKSNFVSTKTCCCTKKYFMSTKTRRCCIKKIFCVQKSYFFYGTARHTIPPCWAGPFARVHMETFRLA